MTIDLGHINQIVIKTREIIKNIKIIEEKIILIDSVAIQIMTLMIMINKEEDKKEIKGIKIIEI